LEQAVKPVPAKGGGAKAAAKGGVIWTLAGCFSSILDELPSSSFLQMIIQSVYQPVSRYQKELLITLAQALSLVVTGVVSSEVYHRHWPQHQQ
jgi:hypothetical protein